MQYVVWGLLLLLLLEILVFFYIYIYLPLKRVRDLTEALAEGKDRSNVTIQGALGLDSLIKNLERIDARIVRLGYHVSTEKLNLHAVLASIVEGVMVVNSAYRIKLVNDELMKLFNLEHSPVEKTVADALKNKDAQTIISHTISQSKKTSQEMTIEGPSGKRIFEVNAVPLMDIIDTHCTGAVVTFHDITSIRALDDMRRDFISNVSHELRTPLAIFKSYLETMLSRPNELSPEAQRMSQVLQRHSERLNTLVEDLLTLSRLESGQIHLETAIVNTSNLLQQISEEWTRLYQAKGLHLATNVKTTLPSIEADPLRLEQVFSNLLENAMHYSKPNGMVEIGAILEQEKRTITFFVKDNGIGIPSEKIAHIFDRFFRVDPARSRELGGTGLGLAIVKSIIDKHRGMVWAESFEGKGTTIYFTLPLIDSSSSTPADRERQPSSF
ncbi:MAG: ATP-binding protein [Verrucomicrobiota bacterium]